MGEIIIDFLRTNPSLALFLLDEMKSSNLVIDQYRVSTLQEVQVLKKRQMRAPKTRVDITAIMIQVHKAAPSPAQLDVCPSSSVLWRKTAAGRMLTKIRLHLSCKVLPPLQLFPPPLAAPPFPLASTRTSEAACISKGNILLS